MNLYKLFKTDKEKETGEGITLNYGEAKITIHRAGGSNAKYRKQNNANLRKFGRDIELGTLDPETDNRIMAELYADTIIIGWEGVNDESGKPLPFTRESVVKLLTDLPELFVDIRKAALDVALFKQKEMEDDLGKPGPA